MSLFVLHAAGATFLVLLALPLWRLSPRGGGREWALAWCALFASGLALRLAWVEPGLRFLYPMTGTLFAALLFAGARRYGGRRLPHRYAALALGLASLRGGLVLVAPPVVTTIGAVGVISLAAVGAAREVLRDREGRRLGPAEALLVVGLVALVGTTSVYEWMKLRAADPQFGFFLWFVSSCFVAGTQIAAIFEQYRTELEARLVERGEQLRASLLRLEEQQRLAAVGTLAAGIAHQINNPIGAIAAAAQFGLLAGDDPDRDAVREGALTTVVEEARRCGRIVRSVLQFARQEPTTKWVEDLGPVVVCAAELAREYVVERGGRLDVCLVREPLPVRLCPLDLEQAVVNLVRNAAESRRGGAQVEVETLRIGDEAVVRIADDGDGIDPCHRSRVLEPFFTTRLAEGGSGLGLSVAHGIVSDHGGTIALLAANGGGTCVEIRLPIAKSD